MKTPRTHIVHCIDKFGRKQVKTYTHDGFFKSLPDILEHGYINFIQYYVTAGGETRRLDYYNVWGDCNEL